MSTQKKVYLTIASLILSTKNYSQFKVPKASEVKQKITSEGAGWIDIVNYILGFMCFAGLIYVIAGLLGKREMSKGIIIAWILCIVLWGLGNAVLLNK